MCKQCCEGDVSWSLPNAQRAAKYHTKLLLRILERLDLPLTHLQELRLAATRANRRRVARLPTSGHWRSSPWGALYLSLETRCPVWQCLSDAVSSSQDADSKVKRPCLATFTASCLSSSEADLMKEAETHLCAALRHLSAIAGAISAVRSFKESGGFHDLELGPSIDSARLCRECSDLDGVSLDYDRLFKELLEVAWPFFLRTQLSNALLEGDILRAAAWAVQFLGIAEPWGLRRVQELTSLGLELAAEHLSVRSSSATQDAGQDGDAWNLLRGACAAYLTVPIIPRFETRLRRTVSRLAELGLYRHVGSAEESCGQSALERSLNEILKPEQQTASSRDFDAAGTNLVAFRDADALYVAFRQELSNVAVEHLDGSCELEVQKAAIAGIEAICALEVGGAMQESRQLQLEEAVASVLQEPFFRKVASCKQRPTDSASVVARSLPVPPLDKPIQLSRQILAGEMVCGEPAVTATSIGKRLLELPKIVQVEDAPTDDAIINTSGPARECGEDGETQKIDSGPDTSIQPSERVEIVAGHPPELLAPPRPPSHFSMPSPPKEVRASPDSKQPASEQERALSKEPKSPMPLRRCPEMLLATQAGKISGKQLCQTAVSSRMGQKVLDLPVAKDAIGGDDLEEPAISTPSTCSSTSLPASSPSNISEASADDTMVPAQNLGAEVADCPRSEAILRFVPPLRSCAVAAVH